MKLSLIQTAIYTALIGHCLLLPLGAAASTTELGPPVKITGIGTRSAGADRLPDPVHDKALPHRSRLTWRTASAKVQAANPVFADEDLTDQIKGFGPNSRPIRHLSPALMKQVSALSDPRFLRKHLNDRQSRGAPRIPEKNLPWTNDQKLANPTNMNDEYVSIAENALTGNLYAVFAAKDLGGTDRDIHIAQSTDAGVTWTVWEMPSFLEDEYQPNLAIDGAGYLHVTWIRADGYILRSRTTNPDVPTQWAWVKGLAVGEPCATPSIAVSGAGDFAKVFIAAGWLTINASYTGYEWTMIFMSSSNGGNSVVYDYFLPDGYPDYWPDVTMTGGTVHYVNAEVDAYTGETEILIASDAYTGSFASPASLTGWTSNNTGFPQIASEGSDVFVVYQLDWAGGLVADGDIMYSYSWDNGATWFGPYGMIADEYDSVGPTVFVKNGVVGCLWLDAPPGADAYQLGTRLGAGHGDISFFGGVEIATEQPYVVPTFHSAAGAITADVIHAAWIDRRDFATEGHNVYTSRHPLQPNLTPFTPADWDSSLLANMIRGDRTEGWLAAGDTAFVSFAFLNDGLKNATADFLMDLVVDDVVAASWQLAGGLATGTYVPLEDYPLVLAAGQHTIQLVLDPTNTVREADETDNTITRTYTWINGDAELRFRPTSLITVIAPLVKRAEALKLSDHPLTRREVNLPVISSDLQAALGLAKKQQMLRVMIVPAERLDPTAMRSALKDAAPTTRREVMLAASHHQMALNESRLAPSLTSLVDRGLALPPKALWLPGMIAMTMSPAAIAELAHNPQVGLLWLDNNKSETFGKPTTAGGATTLADKALAWHISALGADQAWAAGDSGSGIIVGHLDTGAAYDHPDLAGHLWQGGPAFPNHGWDAVANDNDPYDGDTNWYHGTHTAGLIVGDGTAGTTTGIAPGAQLMILRSIPGFFADMITAMQFGLDHGVQIFTMSAGWSVPPNDVRVANRYNAELLLGMDIPWVCAAGNGNNAGGHNPLPTDIASPGDCPNPWYAPNGGQTAVITVGAVDNTNAVSATSSYGPTAWNTVNPNGTVDYHDYPYPSGLMKPDVAAPGVAIVSTTVGSGYVSYDGTSMACPLVTGALCVVMAATPGLLPAQLAEILETSAQDVVAAPAISGRDAYSGAGLVNIPAALAVAPTVAPLRVKITNYGNLPLVFKGTYAQAAWIQVAAPTGFIAPGASVFVDVTISPAGMIEGTYESTIYFVTNDPRGPLQLPVTLIYGNYVTGVGDDLPVRPQGDLDNYPNPFNPRTVLRFATTKSGQVRLNIHDVRGLVVRRLVSDDLAPGAHEVIWDGLNEQGAAVASGVYFARLTKPVGPPVSHKLTLVR